MERTPNHPHTIRPLRPRKRVRPAGPAPRQRALEQQLLHIKLAQAEERVELVARLAEDERLSLTERRQVLLAVQHYSFGQRSDTPRNLSDLLEAVISISDHYELRLKALELFRLALESLRREEVVEQLMRPLDKLLRTFLPKGAAVEFSPELYLRVSQRLEQGDPRSVVDLVTLGLFFFPFDGSLRELRADFSILEGNLAGARADFDRLIDQFPERVGYRLDRGEVSIKLEDFEEALDDLEFYLRHFPKDPVAMRRQAECLYQLGRNLESLKVLDAMLQLEGGKADTYLCRARVNEQLDFLEDALGDVEKAQAIDSDSAEARQLKHSLILKRQSMGVEDDLYSAFLRGDSESIVHDTKIPELRFSDIGGLEKAKQTLKETIEYPLKYPEISERYGKKAGGGLLFFGPPGCGKTMLARAAAGECGVTFINVNLATVLDKWVGNTEKAVSMVFNAARKHAPSIIFLDEVEAIGGSRANMQSGWEKKLISQLLIELDGLTSINENVMVLAASNAPWDVDFALRRPGRLGKLVFVPPPGLKEREEIFALYLKRKPFVAEDIDLAALAKLTEHYSADAIRQIVENAASIPWREAIESGEARAISQADLRAAISQTAADLAEWEKLVERYKEFAEKSLKRPGIGFRKEGN